MQNTAESTPDARVLKTQKRLRSAALDLASRQSIKSISVTELSTAAGINRATFYKHAENPFQVVKGALEDDLDQLRTSFLNGTHESRPDFRQMWSEAVVGTVEHVKKFERIYELGFAENADGELQNLLSKHISKSMQMLFSENPQMLPKHAKKNREFLITSTAAFLGSGLTSVLRVWLQSGASDVALYESAVLSSLPAWMLSTDSSDGGFIK